MPTRDELANALRKADAAATAGDQSAANDARRLAAAIRAMDSQGPAAAPQPVATPFKPAAMGAPTSVQRRPDGFFPADTPEAPLGKVWQQHPGGAVLQNAPAYSYYSPDHMIKPEVRAENAQRQALIERHAQGIQQKVDQFKAQNDPSLLMLKPEARTPENAKLANSNPAPGAPFMPASMRKVQNDAQAFGQDPIDRQQTVPGAITSDLGKLGKTAHLHLFNAGVGASEGIANIPSDTINSMGQASAEMEVTPDMAMRNANRMPQLYDLVGKGPRKFNYAPKFDFDKARMEISPEDQSISGLLMEGFAQYMMARAAMGPGGLGKDILAIGTGFPADSGRVADMMPLDKIPEGTLRDFVGWMKTQPGDTPIMGRIKNMGEDGLLNLLALGMGKTAKSLVTPARVTPTNAGALRPGSLDTTGLPGGALPPAITDAQTRLPITAVPPTAPRPRPAQAAPQGRSAEAMAAAQQQAETRARLQAGIDAAKARGDTEVAAQLESQLLDSTFIIDPQTGQRVGRASPATARGAQQPKSMFSSKADYSVATEDGGTFGVSFNRTKDGGAVIFHDKGTVEYNPEFAKGKSDEELLAYTFEPAGFQGATKGSPAQAATQAPPVTPPQPVRPPVATQTAQAGAPPIPPQPPVTAATSAPVPGPVPAGPVPPAGTLTPAGNGVAVDSFNNLPVKTREGVLRALEASGMNRQQAFDAITSLNDLPPDRANMFEFELIRRYGGPDKFPNLQANLTAMGSDFSIQTPKKGGSPQDVMNKSLLDQAQSEGDYLTRTAEQLFGEGKVATKEELDAFRQQLGGRYRDQLAQTYPGVTRLRNAASKQALQQNVDAARKNLTEYLLRPDVIEQVPPWVQDQVMMQVSDDLRWLQKDDAGLQFASRANPELTPLLTSDQTLRYSPQLWRTLVEMYPTQVAHSLQSAYRAAIDDAFSGVSNAIDRTTAKRLMRLRGQSRVRANAADPNKRGFGLLHLLEEASPGYKDIRQKYGDVVGAQKAADMPDSFFRIAKDEEALADFMDVYDNELTPLQQNAVRNGITTQIRQALKNKTEFTQPWEVDAASRGHLPNLTAVSSQSFLEALPKVFGADGQRMADAIRLSRSNIDNIQAINKNFASGTPKGMDIRENARNLYEHPSATNQNPVDAVTSTLATVGLGSAFTPGGQAITVAALTGAAGRALYRMYKNGKSLSPSQKEALAEWLFKPRRETDVMPPSTPRGFSKAGYAGNVVTGTALGAAAGATTGNPEDIGKGALVGAMGGAVRAGLRARRAGQSIIKPPSPRPRGGPPQGPRGRINAGVPTTPLPPPAQMGFFGSGRRPPAEPPRQVPRRMEADIDRPAPDQDLGPTIMSDLPFSRQSPAVQDAIRRSNFLYRNGGYDDAFGFLREGNGFRYYISREPPMFGDGAGKYRVTEPTGYRRGDSVKTLGKFDTLDEVKDFLLTKLDPRMDDLLAERPNLGRELAGLGVTGIRGKTADGELKAIQLPQPKALDATFDPSQSGSSKLLAGMGGVSPEVATAVGTAGYYELNPYDSNGDGKIDEFDRPAYLMSAMANAAGVHVGKRAIGAMRKLGSGPKELPRPINSAGFAGRAADDLRDGVEPPSTPKPPTQAGYGGSKLPMDEASRTKTLLQTLARPNEPQRVADLLAGTPVSVTREEAKEMLDLIRMHLRPEDPYEYGKGFGFTLDELKADPSIAEHYLDYNPTKVAQFQAVLGTITDPSQSGSSKLLAGIGGNGAGVGAAIGGPLGYITARDSNGDGVVSDEERRFASFGGMMSGGLLGGLAGTGANRLRLGKVGSGPKEPPTINSAGFGGGRKTSGPPRVKLKRSVMKEIELAKNTLPPEVRNKLAANAALPPSMRVSAAEASGDHPAIYTMAAPFQRPRGRNTLAVIGSDGIPDRRPRPNPIDQGVNAGISRVSASAGARPTLDMSGENARQAEVQRRKAVSAASKWNTDTNTQAREAAGLPDLPVPKSLATREKEATDLAIIAKRLLAENRNGANAYEQAVAAADQRKADIADALLTGRIATPQQAKPGTLPGSSGSRPPRSMDRPSRAAAQQMADILFDKEQAAFLDDVLSGRVNPSVDNDARNAVILAAGLIGVGGGVAVMADMGRRSEEVRDRQRVAPAPATEPNDPRFVWNWEDVRKNRRAVQTIQSNLNALPPNPSGGRYNLSIDAWGPKTEAAVKRWQFENNFQPTGELTQEQWYILDQQATYARQTTK